MSRSAHRIGHSYTSRTCVRLSPGPPWWCRCRIDAGSDGRDCDNGQVTEHTRWLEQDQQRSWRALLMGMTLLRDRLDADLRRLFDLSLAEYEVLVRLSENDGQLRMAQLADAMAHSRSRITHTIS